MGRRTKFNIPGYMTGLERKLKTKMEKVGAILRRYAIQKLSQPSNGGKSPSRPGEFPHADTGQLRQSITHVVDKDSKGLVLIFGVSNGPANDYARRLELGFFGKDKLGRMVSQLPRPYLRPTVDDNRDRIIKELKF